MGLISGQGGYLSIIDAFITSGKTSNANIAKCSILIAPQGLHRPCFPDHSTQNRNLMPANKKHKNTNVTQKMQLADLARAKYKNIKLTIISHNTAHILTCKHGIM